MRTVYDFSVKDRKGKNVSLKEYANEVLLIVNTATKCGFTPQYEELEKLYEKYHAQGFEVLDFPCNQFGAQAPGTDESIHQFCKLNYGTEFPTPNRSMSSSRSRRHSQDSIPNTNSHPCWKRFSQRRHLTIRRQATSSGTSLSSSSTSAVR